MALPPEFEIPHDPRAVPFLQFRTTFYNLKIIKILGPYGLQFFAFNQGGNVANSSLKI